MKKVFLAIGLIVALGACNNASKVEAPKTDSTKVAVDTVKAKVDTTKVDTTAKVSVLKK